jgi:hypothetical protein
MGGVGGEGKPPEIGRPVASSIWLEVHEMMPKQDLKLFLPGSQAETSHLPIGVIIASVGSIRPSLPSFLVKQHVFQATRAHPCLSDPIHTKLQAWAMIFFTPCWIQPHNARK